MIFVSLRYLVDGKLSLISNDESLDPTGVKSDEAREFLNVFVEVIPEKMETTDESNGQETVEDLLDMM